MTTVKRYELTKRARRAPIPFFAFALCLATLAACSNDGASKKKAERAADQARSSSQAAQSSMQMPPVESAHRTSERAGGWTMLNGQRTSLADYRGQVVVLDFYATYCPPCLEEIPHLVELQRRHAQQGFKVVGLNVGGEEDQAKVPAFVRQLGIQYELGNPDPETVSMFLMGNSAIPQTFVFDRDGQLVRHFTGYDRQIAAELEEAIGSALASKASAEKTSAEAETGR